MEKAAMIRSRYAFFTVPADIWQVQHPDGRPLKMAAKAVYVYLWARASKEAKAFPAVPTIAREVSASTRAVQYAIRDLEALGLLECEERFAHGRQTSNLYTLNIPDDARKLISRRGAPLAPGEGAEGAGDRCSSCIPEGAEGAGEPDPEEPDPPNNNHSVVVVESYRKGTGLSDLSLGQASKWIQTYGLDRVKQKLDMLMELITAGRRIKRPQGWLAKALKQDWQPAADRELEAERRREEQSRKALEDARALEARAQDPKVRDRRAVAIREILQNLGA